MLATIQHSVTVTGADKAGVEVNSSQWNEPHVATFSVGATDISGLFSNANGVSFGLSDSSITASHNALTTAMASNRGTDFVQAAAVFAGTSASGTIASGGISVSIGPYITTAMASNRGSDFVQAAAAFAGTSASGTIASGGISVSIGPYITTAMLSNRGSDFVQANAAFAGTSASGTIASDGISVSIGPYITTAALSNHSHGNPTLALTNLTGTTASASNGFTLSLSGNAAGGGDAIRGIAANGSTASTNTVNFSNANGVSFGFGAAGNSTVITASHNALTTAAQSDHSHGNPTLALTNLSPAGASIPTKVYLSHCALVFPPNQPAHRMAAIGMEVGEAYSNAIEQILAEPNLSQWEYLLTIEHDNAPPVDGLVKLIKRIEEHPEFACIGGLYWTKGEGGVPQIWGDPKDPVVNFRPQAPVPGHLVECVGTGMGFNLWRLKMFHDKRLRKPWFKTIAGKEGVGTQDLHAWSDFRKYGYRCAIDCDVLVGHYDAVNDQMW